MDGLCDVHRQGHAPPRSHRAHPHEPGRDAARLESNGIQGPNGNDARAAIVADAYLPADPKRDFFNDVRTKRGNATVALAALTHTEEVLREVSPKLLKDLAFVKKAVLGNPFVLLNAGANEWQQKETSRRCRARCATPSSKIPRSPPLSCRCAESSRRCPCSIGQGGEHAKNLANFFASLFPHASIVAPTEPVPNNGLLFADDGSYQKPSFEGVGQGYRIPARVGEAHTRPKRAHQIRVSP